MGRCTSRAMVKPLTLVKQTSIVARMLSCPAPTPTSSYGLVTHFIQFIGYTNPKAIVSPNDRTCEFQGIRLLVNEFLDLRLRFQNVGDDLSYPPDVGFTVDSPQSLRDVFWNCPGQEDWLFVRFNKCSYNRELHHLDALIPIRSCMQMKNKINA